MADATPPVMTGGLLAERHSRETASNGAHMAARCHVMLQGAFPSIVWIAAVSIAKVDAGEVTPRPNVLVILTDDQGSADAGCYGAKDLATPAHNGSRPW